MNMTPEEERDALIDRYLNRKMNPEEELEFEIRMMDDPLLFEDVQTVGALKEGLHEHADLLASHPPHEATFRAGHLPFKLWLQQPPSLAATLLVAAIGAGWALEAGFERDISLPGDSNATIITTLLVFEKTRSNEPLEFSGQPPYLLQIDAGLENVAKNISIDLIDSEANRLLLHTEATADSDGWIRLLVTSDLPEQFDVELADPTNEHEQTYSARLLK